jgi:ribosomal protein S18 acetylase RimI-like enzyme
MHTRASGPGRCGNVRHVTKRIDNLLFQLVSVRRQRQLGRGSSSSSSSGSSGVVLHSPVRTSALSTAQVSTQEFGGLIEPVLFNTCCGDARIRQLDAEADLLPAADIQAHAFHEALPLGGALDALALTMFKAEVLDGLKKKSMALNADGFAMLVAERWPAVLADSRQLQEKQQQQQQQQQQQLPPGVDPTIYRGGRVGSLLGIVEVGLQEDSEVLEALGRLGSSSAGDSRPYAYVTSMAVASEIRRCGLGTALLRAAEQQAARWGARHVVLHVHESNTAAAALYAARGLRCVARDPSWRGLVPGGRVRLLLAKPVHYDSIIDSAAAAGA